MQLDNEARPSLLHEYSCIPGRSPVLPFFGKFTFELLAVSIFPLLRWILDELVHVGETREFLGLDPRIDVGNSLFPQHLHALAFPNLEGFACNPAVFAAVQCTGDAGFPMTNYALMVVHSSPNCDHVVQHFLQRARDTTWV